MYEFPWASGSLNRGHSDSALKKVIVVRLWQQSTQKLRGIKRDTKGSGAHYFGEKSQLFGTEEMKEK